MIVKVQRPLNRTGVALVYNEDRSFETHVPTTSVEKEMDGTYKRYFYAEKTQEGFKLGKVAPCQTW